MIVFNVSMRIAMNIAQSTYSENGINGNTISRHHKAKSLPKDIKNQTVEMNMGTMNKNVQADSHKSVNSL